MAEVVSVHVGAPGTMGKSETDSISLEIDGIVGDRHRGITRECWEGDKQKAGAERRNERMWSASSIEELEEISTQMGLGETLRAATIGVNLCFKGIPGLSKLPRGTVLKFSSGVELMVEEYNPPCSDMGRKVAEEYQCLDGSSPAATAFSRASKFSRGIVGVVEVAGKISVGDRVEVIPERLPKWLRD